MNQARYLIHRVGTPLVVATEAGVYVVAGEWWHNGGWGAVDAAVPIVRLNGSVLPDGGEWVPVHVET